MRYTPELSSYQPRWGEAEKSLKLIAVGWLSITHAYTTGEVPKDFLLRLEMYCTNPIIRNYGIEPCPLCEEGPVVITTHFGKNIKLYGTYEIRIPSPTESIIYAAPDLILHFVNSHLYKPPQEFIDAVLAAPLPGTPEFEQFAVPWKQYR